MDKQLHIALLTDGITPFVTGGMQRHSANLAKYFTLAGVKVTLVHAVAFNDEIPSDEEVNKSLFLEGKIKLHKIIGLKFPKAGILPGHYIRNSYKLSKSIFESVDFTDVDFVYAKGFMAWHYINKKMTDASLPPVGVKFHGYEMFQLLPSFKQKLKARMLRNPVVHNNMNADAVFSYGGKITELIKSIGVPSVKILEFTSGIDENWIRKSELNTDEIRKFVFMGRNEVRKGVSEIFQSLEILLKDNSNFEFHFIGPISTPPNFNSEKVKFHGEQKDANKIRELLDNCEVLVCPSHSEGMPNVILEAMSRGLAVIATNVGAVEKVVNDECGKLIEPNNVGQLTEAMKSYIAMKNDELDQMRINSIQRIQNQFLWRVIIDKKIEKIEKIENLIKN